LQVRGSIPLLWSQIPNIKYKPTTRLLASGSPTSAAFDAHFDGLLAKYKVGPTPGSVLVTVLHDGVAGDGAVVKPPAAGAFLRRSLAVCNAVSHAAFCCALAHMNHPPIRNTNWQ
jgi:hypothetical protein